MSPVENTAKESPIYQKMDELRVAIDECEQQGKTLGEALKPILGIGPETTKDEAPKEAGNSDLENRLLVVRDRVRGIKEYLKEITVRLQI